MKKTLIAIVMGTILVGCAATEPAVTESSLKEAGLAPLTAAQLTQTFADNTWAGIGPRSGRDVVTFYAKDGTFKVKVGNSQDTGTWRITKDNLFCNKFTRFDKGVERCWRFYNDGKYYRMFDTNGAPYGKWTVTKGNSQNL